MGNAGLSRARTAGAGYEHTRLLERHFTCSTKCPCDAVPGRERRLDQRPPPGRAPSASSPTWTRASSCGRASYRACGDLWRDLPRINALRQEFGTDADGGYEKRNPLFKEFITRLLMLRNPVALVKFGLWHYIGGSQFEADTTDLWKDPSCFALQRPVSRCVRVGPFLAA